MTRRAATARSPAAGEADATLVLRQFRQVFNAVRAHYRRVERSVGVGGAQLWALALVEEHPGLGIGALARAMDIHQSTASNLARSLVERGLVAAAREGSDRRTVQLRLLPAGRRLLSRAPRPLGGVLPQAIGSLAPQTLRRLKKDLAELIEVMGVHDRGARIPLGQ